LDAVERQDHERARRALRTLEERLLALPPNDALDTLLVHRVARARLTAPARRTLTVGPDAAWFRLGDEKAVSLARHGALRGVLGALLEAEQDSESLLWRAGPASARAWVPNAIECG
jgi:hypothetical protein